METVIRLAIVGFAVAVAAAGAVFSEERLSVIVNPDWLKKPTSEQITAAWPHDALVHGKGGRAQIACRVNVQGLVEDCKVASEDPAGVGFGAAALTLTPQWQFRPATRDGKPIPPDRDPDQVRGRQRDPKRGPARSRRPQPPNLEIGARLRRTWRSLSERRRRWRGAM